MNTTNIPSKNQNNNQQPGFFTLKVRNTNAPPEVVSVLRKLNTHLIGLNQTPLSAKEILYLIECTEGVPKEKVFSHIITTFAKLSTERDWRGPNTSIRPTSPISQRSATTNKTQSRPVSPQTKTRPTSPQTARPSVNQSTKVDGKNLLSKNDIGVAEEEKKNSCR